MKKISLALLGLIAGAAFSSASAADLTAPPGVYYGSGNVNGNFTVTTTNGIEVGQRAIDRYLSSITPVGNVYTAPVGPTTVAGKTGSEWGFVFSVNTAGSGYTLANTYSTLTVTDSYNMSSATFNINDNSVIGDNVYAGGAYTGLGFQNSEALSFANIKAAVDPAYDMWVASTYTFTLDVFDAANNNLLNTNTIVVNAVPEPLTLSLFAAGLVGAGALRRRKKVQA